MILSWVCDIAEVICALNIAAVLKKMDVAALVNWALGLTFALGRSRISAFIPTILWAAKFPHPLELLLKYVVV